MLKIEDLQVYYGAIHAIKGASLEVNEGEVVTLIGANGAGKTTILHTVTGLVKARSGRIEYDGNNLLSIPPHKIVSLGLAHVPEGRQLFTRMSVEENLLMGAYHRKDNAAVRYDLGRIYKLFPRLDERKFQISGTLSGGEQQMVAMGRAMMSQPKMIVMDEPSMGLSPILVKDVFRMIREMHELGITVLLVEQNASMALSIADRGYVLENGHITLSGTSQELLNDDRVRKAYFGAN